MIRRTQLARTRQAGFSLIELLIAVIILMIIMGSVMGQVTSIHRRSQAESSKMDIVQESREAMDQLTRDLHQAGYPNRTMYDQNQLILPTWMNDPRVAMRLVAIGPNWIFFEGDVDGSGQVSVVRYRLVGASAESTRCPCIERGQLTPKVTANPFLGQPVTYHLLAENVSSFTITAFDQNGAPVALGAGLDMNGSPATLLGTVAGQPMIKTISATLTVQSPTADLASKLRPSATVSTIVELKN
jgi:prepilin-type N-terminal cleavage/methylation domain-containing protein